MCDTCRVMIDDELPPQLVRAGSAVHRRVVRGSYRAEDLVADAEEFVRRNPWVAVAGAAMLSGVLSALNRRKPVRTNSSRAALRDWIDDAHAGLPSKKQFRSAAQSAGLPTTLEQLRKKLGGE